jgi:hypothetical protein
MVDARREGEESERRLYLGGASDAVSVEIDRRIRNGRISSIAGAFVAESILSGQRRPK